MRRDTRRRLLIIDAPADDDLEGRLRALVEGVGHVEALEGAAAVRAREALRDEAAGRARREVRDA